MATAHGERRGQRALPAKGGDQRNRQRRPAQLSRVNAAYGTRVGQSQVRGVVVCAGIQRDALWRGAAALGEPQESKSSAEGWGRETPASPPYRRRIEKYDSPCRTRNLCWLGTKTELVTASQDDNE